MVVSEGPDVREICVDVGWSEYVLEAVSFSDMTTFLIIFGENQDIRILIREVLIWSMALNKLINRDLPLSKGKPRWGGVH